MKDFIKKWLGIGELTSKVNQTSQDLIGLTNKFTDEGKSINDKINLLESKINLIDAAVLEIRKSLEKPIEIKLHSHALIDEAILEYLNLKGQASFSEIVSQTGRSKPTISEYLDRLEASGKIKRTQIGRNVSYELILETTKIISDLDSQAS